MTNAIKRLQDDIQRLHSAERRRDAGAKVLKQDDGALKGATGALKRDRDAFDTQRKQLKRDDAALGRMHDTMDGFATQQSSLQQQLAADPSNAALAAQLASVEQKEAALQARIDPAAAARDRLTQRHSDLSKQLAADTRDKTADQKKVKSATRELDRARARVKDNRHRARKDLTPAEYKLGLNQTNHVRRELGLGAVKHVLRPGGISPHGKQQMHNLERVAKAYASGRRPEGWCLKKVEDYLGQVSYGKIGHGNIPRFPYAHDFADSLNAGQRYKQLGLQKLHISNPYDAPPGSIIVVRAGTPGTANPVAGDIVVKGYGDHFYNDGEMGYGGPQNFPKGNSYVLGIYAPK